MLTFDDLDLFTQQYIETALWSSNDESTPEGGNPMDDNYGPEDLSAECLARCAKDCESFQLQYSELWEADDKDSSEAGHDFWLTRNGHGCGFWDGDYPTHGDKLSDAAMAYGEVNLMVNGDTIDCD